MSVFWDSSEEAGGPSILNLYLNFMFSFPLISWNLQYHLYLLKYQASNIFSHSKDKSTCNDKNDLAHSKCINIYKCSALSNCCYSITFHRSSSYRKSEKWMTTAGKKDGVAHIWVIFFGSCYLRLSFRNLCWTLYFLVTSDTASGHFSGQANWNIKKLDPQVVFLDGQTSRECLFEDCSNFITQSKHQ